MLPQLYILMADLGLETGGDLIQKFSSLLQRVLMSYKIISEDPVDMA